MRQIVDIIDAKEGNRLWPEATIGMEVSDAVVIPVFQEAKASRLVAQRFFDPATCIQGRRIAESFLSQFRQHKAMGGIHRNVNCSQRSLEKLKMLTEHP